jgi:hypothetical protein
MEMTPASPMLISVQPDLAIVDGLFIKNAEIASEWN